MGVVALRQNLGDDTTREEAQAFLMAYFHTFTRLAEYLEATKVFARQHGYTETLFGRRRLFPGITSNAPFIRAQAERMAINAPIQGTQADIIRLAMVQISEWIEKEQSPDNVRMLIQVHDELVFEIKDGLLQTIIPRLENIMTTILNQTQTEGVPVLVDVAVGKNWADMVEWVRPI